jgi:hypothetical protein
MQESLHQVKINNIDGRVKKLLERAFNHYDFHLIKIVKNILKYSDDNSINQIFENFIDNQFMKVLKKQSDSIEFLKETFEILSYIDTNWEDKLVSHGLISFIEKYLGDQNIHDDLVLPLIHFLGNIASNSVLVI